MPDHSRYRILSLDGGGCWALIQARALLDIYGDIPGRQLLAKFQLVAANSGGSIVAAALAADLSTGAIVDRFMDKQWRQKMFVYLPWPERIIRILGLGPRFSTEAKLRGLQAALGSTADLKLSDLPRVINPAGGSSDFLIVGFDYDRERAVFFRSNDGSKAASFSPHVTPTLAEAVHASSTAPINFFDKPAVFPRSNARYWDGAVSGNNNPVMAAVVEAICNGVRPADIGVLSIGTANVRRPLAGADPPLVAPAKNQGLFSDIKEIAGSIIDDPPDAATFIAHAALGGKLPDHETQVIDDSPVVRMNPMIQPIFDSGRWKLPGDANQNPEEQLTTDDFNALATLDIAAIEDDEMAQIKKLCDLWLKDIVPNQGIRSRNDNFAVEVGHATYGKARATWLTSP